MTVQPTTNYVIHQGTGVTTIFPYNFRFPEMAAVNVSLMDEDNEVIRVLAPDEYTITGVGANSGAVVYTPALPLGQKILIARLVPYTQDLALTNEGGFYPETLEDQLDRIVMQIQQLASETARAWKSRIGEEGGMLTRVPEGHIWVAEHRSDGSIRMVDGGFSDTSAIPGLVERAEDAAENAEDAADRAEIAAGSIVAQVQFKTVADLIADDSLIGYAGSGAAITVVAGDVVGADGFRYQVAAIPSADYHVATANGVLLYVLPHNGNEYYADAFNIARDGSDVSAAIKAWIDVLVAKGDCVGVLGRGNYGILSGGSLNIPLTARNVTIRGQGTTRTTLAFGSNPADANNGYVNIRGEECGITDLMIDAGDDPSLGVILSPGLEFRNNANMFAKRVHVINAADQGINGVWSGGSTKKLTGLLIEDCSADNCMWGISVTGEGSTFDIIRPRITNMLYDGVTVRGHAGPGNIIAGVTDTTGHSGFSVTAGLDIKVIGCTALNVPENPGVDPVEAGFECESRAGLTSRRVQFIGCEARFCHTGFVFRERDGDGGALGFDTCQLIGGLASQCTNGIVVKDSGSNLIINGLNFHACATPIVWDRNQVAIVSWTGLIGANTSIISGPEHSFLSNGEMMVFKDVVIDPTVAGYTDVPFPVAFPPSQRTNISASWNLHNNMGGSNNIDAWASAFVINTETGWRFYIGTAGTGADEVTVRLTAIGRWRT